ncbi:MAG: hypothetical protein J6A51_00115 [Clostridia bacterium]|nr:hypothetical protein [Clostridia bacterium]
MNLKYNRLSIGSKEFVRDAEGNVSKVQVMRDIKPYDSESTSIFYRGVSNIDGRNGIKKGDIVYFKANNSRGVNYLGDTEESKGSCEDVAEVLCFYILRALKENTKGASVLVGTPYEFADYSHEDFWKMVKKQTGGLVESDRLYGCISKNVLDEDGIIIRGNTVLREIIPETDVKKSSKNTLFNYANGYESMVKSFAENGQILHIHPMSNRYNTNLIFFDYFTSNADRHCMNVCSQRTPIADGSEFVLKPVSVLDNGGAFAMQSRNCEKMYAGQVEFLQREGKLRETNLNDGYFNPFMVTYDFSAGKETFANPELAAQYDELSAVEQMIMLISQNKTLFNDFKLMYNNLDVQKAMNDMRTEVRFPVSYGKDNNYLPGLPVVLMEAIRFKREQVSKIMAKMLGEEYSETKFEENDNYYLEKFEKQLVQDDALTIHIASDQEIKEFEESMKAKQEQKTF